VTPADAARLFAAYDARRAYAEMEGITDMLAEQGCSPDADGLRTLIERHRAEVEALTPGPWVPVSEAPVPITETVQVHERRQGPAPRLWTGSPDLREPHFAVSHWRRIPAALLTPPEGT
jgi:hypothetical protein